MLLLLLAPRPVAILLVAVASTFAVAAPARRAADGIERVQPNDNRRPAGRMRGGVLRLRLEARMAMWHPDGDDAPGAPTAAFAEEGAGPARIPGPLVRVRAGTEVEVRVANALRDTLVVYGLHGRGRAAGPSGSPITLAPGARRTVRFRLDAPGTYYYWGTTTHRGIDYRTLGDAQLSGAIVVDGVAAAAGPPRDRILVIGMWTDTVHRARTHRRRVLGVVNGRSWPHTEHLEQAVGDTVRWRVINASADAHPMHLHGFYFRVESRGDGARDAIRAPGTGDLAVTETMSPGTTMSMTWVPERAGNWLFHCHVPEHFGARASLGMERTATGDAGAHADHARGGMSGLVMGITVRPARGARVARRAAPRPDAYASARHVRLLVRAQRGSTAGSPRFAYALHEGGGAEPAVDSGVGIGPVLELERGRPVRITVVNRLAEPTAVHWHGIELESFYDGVPGFSGAAPRTTPLIAPGDSFEVRFTPPRSGTFIYHTHADETHQQIAGLQGVILVREPGTPAVDRARDIPIMFTESADSAERARGVVLVDGRAVPTPMALRLGTTYRLRFVQMSVTRSVLRLELMRDSSVMTWRPIAKDGADRPLATPADTTARTRLGIGETLDVEVTPMLPGRMRLDVSVGLRWPLPSPLLASVPIIVLPR